MAVAVAAAVAAAAVVARYRPTNPTTTTSPSDPTARVDPMVAILSAVSAPGRPDRANEDGYGSVGRFAWVIDGATGLGDEELLDAPSDAAWLTGALGDVLSASAGDFTDPAALLSHAAALCERRFLAERRRAPRERYEIPTAAVLLAHFGAGTVTIAEVGDCGAYFRAPDGAITRFGGTEAGRALEQSNARNMMVPGRDRRSPDVLGFLRRVRNRANTPGGYSIFAPEAAAASAARIFRHRATAGDALFVSDGFEAAVDDYGLYDAAGLFAAVRDDIKLPLDALREVEDKDPDCQRFPRFKKSDDATAMLVRFGAVQ
ncbi:MAG: PP2C family serine/threonine-protein phosphatase [Acuticoccus sp.]